MYVTFFSLLMWLVTSAIIIPIMWMFDFHLPIYAPLAILACIALGLSLPSAPGGIGIISFATIFSMKILFVEIGYTLSDNLYAKIVAFSLLINVVLVLPEIVLGMFFIIKDGVKLFELNKGSLEKAPLT